MRALCGDMCVEADIYRQDIFLKKIKYLYDVVKGQYLN